VRRSRLQVRQPFAFLWDHTIKSQQIFKFPVEVAGEDSDVHILITNRLRDVIIASALVLPAAFFQGPFTFRGQPVLLQPGGGGGKFVQDQQVLSPGDF